MSGRAALVVSTLKVPAAFAAGPAAAGVIPVQVVALTKGVLKAMLLSKLKLVAGVVVALAVFALGGGLFCRGLAAAAASGSIGLPLPASFGANADASKDDETLKNTLLTMEKAWYDASAQTGAEAYGKFLADDYVGFAENARYTKADKLRTKEHQHIGADYKMSDVELIRLNDKAAILSYKAQWTDFSNDTGKQTGTRNCRYSTCWVQRGGGWVIAFTQATAIVGDD